MRGNARSNPSLRFALAVIVAALALPASAYAQANQFKRIRDISVSCTASLRCDLQAYNARAPLYSVVFRRAASPNAPLNLVLGVRETLAAGSEVTFYVDGRQVVAIPVADLHYRAAVYEYNYSGTDRITALMDAAMGGSELRVSYRPAGTGTVSTFSLAGFVAGLVFMDEVQARVGQPDALVAETPGPLTGEEMVTEIDAVTDVPFQIRNDFRDEGSPCGGLTEAQFGRADGFEANSGGDTWLIGLPCGAEDSFNQPYRFWERTGSAFREVPLPIMTVDGPSTTDRAWNITWDQDSQQLTGFHKGRGAGDCGVFNRWVWTERDESHVFVLKESREKGQCDGDMAGGPEEWPLVWPAQG